MGVFLEVDGLAELEQAKDWKGAIALLHRLWQHDKNNPKKTCRLMAECWYVLAFWEYYGGEGLSFAAAKELLMDVTNDGLAHNGDDAEFLWITGYMISLFPELFYTEEAANTYEIWQDRGRAMLRKAAGMAPKNQIAKTLSIGANHGNWDAYLREKSKLSGQLEAAFPGKTAVEAYFKEVLSV